MQHTKTKQNHSSKKAKLSNLPPSSRFLASICAGVHTVLRKMSQFIAEGTKFAVPAAVDPHMRAPAGSVNLNSNEKKLQDISKTEEHVLGGGGGGPCAMGGVQSGNFFRSTLRDQHVRNRL
jgi:hypothetical protein